jgi:hypothetical protein
VGLLAAACGGPQKPKERTTPGVGVTVYNDGVSVVKEWRRVDLAKGRSQVRFTDVARLVDPTSVSVRSVTDPDGAHVLEQQFEFDVVSADKLLGKYVGLDRPITLVLDGGREVRGRLLSFDAGRIVLETDDAAAKVQILERHEQVRAIRLALLPEGLITKPTLVWDVDASKGGAHVVKVAYQTTGLSWSADYTAVLGAGDRALDLAGWVTVNNTSGATYDRAELKLVAGDVHRAPPPQPVTTVTTREAAAKSEVEEDRPAFVEKSFFEYHLYTLGRQTTIADQSVKQIELFDPVESVPIVRKYMYRGAPDHPWGGSPLRDRSYGTTTNRKVDVIVELKNEKTAGLGMPLPMGRVRVYKTDPSDGSVEMVAEDRIDHTPKDEEIRLRVGTAFDVTGERKQTAYAVDVARKEIVETFEVTIANHKDEDVEVVVVETMFRWVTWKIIAHSHQPWKKDARTVHFPVKVAKNGRATLTYSVRYTW